MFNIKMTGQDKLKSVLDPNKYVAAARTAYAEAHANSLLQASTLVSGRYNVAPQFLLSGSTGIKPILQASRIGSDGLSGSITTRQGGIGLINFLGSKPTSSTARTPARPGQQRNKPPQQRKAGLQVSVLRGKTTQLRQFYANAKGSGATGNIYRRAGRARLPIIRSAVSPASMLKSPTVAGPLADFFIARIKSAFSIQLRKQGVTP